VNNQSTSGSVGAGQQYPEDSNSDYSTTVFIVRQMMALLEIMTPVQVVHVHPGSGSPPAAGTVDVQPLVSQLDGSGNAVQHGIVYGLPYFRLQGGSWSIICDPAVNDFGFIVSASRDISNVVKKPGIQNPGSNRKYSYSDSVYLGGMINAVPAATLWLKSDGTWVLTDKPGNVLQGTSSGITMTPVSGQALTVNGPITATGKITGSDFSDGTVTSYKTHTHSGVTTGGGTSGPPTPGS
jgi:hypothetical protein